MRAIVAVLIYVFACSALAFQNEPSGFRGLQWGDPPTDEFTHTTTNENVSLYLRRDEKMTIGEATLQQLTYAFYKGRFYTAFLTTDGASNGRALLRALEAQFGPGVRPNRYMDRYFWAGPQTLISYNCRISQRECTTLIGSQAIQKERERDQKEAAAKAKGDF